jgi:predicted metal-binding protein
VLNYDTEQVDVEGFELRSIRSARLVMLPQPCIMTAAMECLPACMHACHVWVESPPPRKYVWGRGGGEAQALLLIVTLMGTSSCHPHPAHRHAS